MTRQHIDNLKPDEIALIRASGAWVRYDAEHAQWIAMDVNRTIPMGEGDTVREALENLEAQR